MSRVNVHLECTLKPDEFLQRLHVDPSSIHENIPEETDRPCYWCEEHYDHHPVPVPIQERPIGDSHYYFCNDRMLCCSFNCAKAQRNAMIGEQGSGDTIDLVYRMAYHVAKREGCDAMKSALIDHGLAEAEDRHVMEKRGGRVPDDQYSRGFFRFPRSRQDDNNPFAEGVTRWTPDPPPDFQVFIHGIHYVESIQAMYDSRTKTMITNPDQVQTLIGRPESRQERKREREENRRTEPDPEDRRRAKWGPRENPMSTSAPRTRRKRAPVQKKTKVEKERVQRVKAALRRSEAEVPESVMEPKKNEGNSWSAHGRRKRRPRHMPSLSAVKRRADAEHMSAGTHPDQIAARKKPRCGLKMSETVIPTLQEQERQAKGMGDRTRSRS